VPYTVVSRGRVLGTTEFEYVRCMERLRAGTLSPSEGADDLIDIAVGVSPASFSLSNKSDEIAGPAGRDSVLSRAQLRQLGASTEHADFASACDRRQALELELRGPNGALIETEDVWIQDTEFLLSLPDPDLPECDWDEESLDFGPDCVSEDLMALGDAGLFDESDEWDAFDLEWSGEEEQPFPRYQVFARLVNDADVP